MARIPDDVIQQIKMSLAIAEICKAHGIKLRKHGSRDLIGKCPFHDDKEPSFVVSPRNNLFHCLGCGAKGSVIDLVMNLERVDFRGAVDLLLERYPNLKSGSAFVSLRRDSSELLKTAKNPEKSVIFDAETVEILENMLKTYVSAFKNAENAQNYLKNRGLDPALLNVGEIGFSDGLLGAEWVKNRQLKEKMVEAGLLLKNGRARFENCLVFPIRDEAGQLVTIYGRFIGENSRKRHVYLPDRAKGIWNIEMGCGVSEIFVTESILDAFSLRQARIVNVLSLNGTNPGAKTVEWLKNQHFARVFCLFDGDKAGFEAAKRLKKAFEGDLPCEASAKQEKCDFLPLKLPENMDPNEFLQAHGPEKLRAFIAEATGDRRQPTRAGAADDSPSPAVGKLDGFLLINDRRYEVQGLERSARKLRATVRVKSSRLFHVDTIDLYSARSRRSFSSDLCRVFSVSPDVIDHELSKLLTHCEKLSEQQKDDGEKANDKILLTAQEKEEAEAFGKRSDLMANILSDMETAGVIGEEANKMLLYLAVTSRRMDDPLSVLILSSSGAGKTALQDAALLFCPEEDVVKLTALSGKALFYKDEMSLKHKVLALEEGAGAEDASYAIRNLISAGELVAEAAIKDPATGRIITMQNRVEGPTAVLLTTTNPNTDPETKSRFFVTSVDESREQTRAILEFQRMRETLAGLQDRTGMDALLRRHHNFQRLLKPVRVINPFSENLSYGDDRLQGRRDQPKYLRLIRAVAFLRQMQKEVKYLHFDHTPVEPALRSLGEAGYIEVDQEDIRQADQLAEIILGGVKNELSHPARALLDEIIKMLRSLLKESPNHSKEGVGDFKALSGFTFTRRKIREHSGWSNYRVITYLKELVEMEYIVAESGRNGSLFLYRLISGGTND